MRFLNHYSYYKKKKLKEGKQTIVTMETPLSICSQWNFVSQDASLAIATHCPLTSLSINKNVSIF